MQSSVFEQTCNDYLSQLSFPELSKKGDLLSIGVDNDVCTIVFFSNTYNIRNSGISSKSLTKIDFTTKVVLLKYLLHASSHEDSKGEEWKPYRSFDDAAPLQDYFENRVVGKISETFSTKINHLQDRVEKCDGELQQVQGWDLVAKFQGLPRIPVMLYFNDKDEMFPATCSLLFHSSAPYYLDMESLAMVGTHLADILTRGDNG